MPLTIPLSRKPGSLSIEIYRWFRQAALNGTLRAGEGLPSTRDLADQLSVSRTVVLRAYDQLIAEGYAEALTGSGTFIAAGLSVRPRSPEPASAKLHLSPFGAAAHAADGRIVLPAPRPKLRYDFAYGRSMVSDFPFETWRRILLKRARAATRRALDYGPAGGSAELREAIATHLVRSRAVVCHASQVIVVSGSQQALDLASRILIGPGDRVVIEDPQYQGTREILRAAGAKLHRLPVDRDGWRLNRLPDRARMAFLTPSHQMPTGAVLPLTQRLELLKWARAADAVIVEDDYDGEFHYDGQPLESMQGLDREGRVIYVGTFSRTVFPALRIGYLVVPEPLVATFTAAKWLCDRHTATLEQDTLADFISTGAYERHLRRTRRKNNARRDALLAAAAEFLGHRVAITGARSGNHVVIWPHRKWKEDELVARAAEKSVGLYGMSRYYLSGQPGETGLLLGYAGLRETEIREGIRRLAEIDF